MLPPYLPHQANGPGKTCFLSRNNRGPSEVARKSDYKI